MRVATAVASVLWALVGVGGSARADDAAGALAHFKAGKQAFRSGELAEKLGQRDEAMAKYRQAVDELKKAYELQPQPVMLWGLGEAYRALGEVEPALEAYRHYVAEATPTQKPNFRAQAQAHIERLERAHAASSAAAAPPRSVTPTDGPVSTSPVRAAQPLPPPAAPAVVTERGSDSARPAGVASVSLLVVALVGVAAGGGLLGHATTIAPDERGITIEERARRTDSQSVEFAAGVGVLAVGAAALVGSAAAFGVWMHRRRGPRTIALFAPVAGGALFTVKGGF